MRDQCLPIRSLIPCITSLTCSRVFLEMRGLFLHPGLDNPPPYASGTLPPYHDPGDDRKDYLGSSRRHNRRGPLLDFLASDLGSGGTTPQFTSAGVYELTSFWNTTLGTEVISGAGFMGGPTSAPSASAQRQHFGLATGHHSLPTSSFPYESIQRKPEEGP